MALAPLAFVSVWVCCQFLSKPALLHLQPCQILPACSPGQLQGEGGAVSGAVSGEHRWPRASWGQEQLPRHRPCPATPWPAEGEGLSKAGTAQQQLHFPAGGSSSARSQHIPEGAAPQQPQGAGMRQHLPHPLHREHFSSPPPWDPGRAFSPGIAWAGLLFQGIP